MQQAHLRALVKAGSLMPLLIERSGSLQITPAEGEWQVGDRLIYLLYDPKPKLLKRLSGSSQQQLTLEELPEVELIPLPEPVLNGAIEAVQSFVTDVADS